MSLKLDKAYDYYIIISYLIYTAVVFGVLTTVPEYLDIVNSFVKFSIACILIYKFNPLQDKYTVSLFDKKIVFTSGVYLLLTTFVGQYFNKYKNIIKDDIHKIINF